MLTKLKSVITKHYDLLIYLVFGVLTTVVNYLVYLPCYNLLCFSASVSNAIAWVAAVAFAYLTNKPFVFKSHDWSAKTVLPELAKFLGCRIGGHPRVERQPLEAGNQCSCGAAELCGEQDLRFQKNILKP